MTGNELRKKYLDFFVSKQHVLKTSDSLIPQDPTLLFTSAGMVQFKPLWLANGPIEFTRATTCQKCFRTPDIERVGRTARHLTFFEMLGNFSFGDYFKEEAIAWAWEWITGDLKLGKNDLWVSVYLDDNEAADIWNKKIGLDKSRIVRLGKKDNFWGPVNPEGGPCGPCSEIYIDHGPSRGCGGKECRPGCDCDRFEEFWNLVFPSYNQDAYGKLNPLPKRGVDTGLGLERLTAIIQGVKSNFETDLMLPILKTVAEKTGKVYGSSSEDDVKLKLIADHARALVFCISDGILPSNEGRGYVIRRILRRAARFGRLLGMDRPFLYQLANTVVETMKTAYPELVARREQVVQVILNEEERFAETLEQGMAVLNELVDESRRKKTLLISGKEAFKLYDTYGFPLELTQEILTEQKMAVDEKEFQQAMKEQQNRARAAWSGSGQSVAGSIHHNIRQKHGATRFTGYDQLETETSIVAIISDGQIKEKASAGDEIGIVLGCTPFYGAAGGQAGDTGVISFENGSVEIIDTIKPLPDLIVHLGKVRKGEITMDLKVKAAVNKEHRLAIAQHHTATHLLQSALRQVLGSHVSQAGSLVEPARLHFDFTHFAALKPVELARVEQRVNELIRENIKVSMAEMTNKEAQKTGALAFFGEKYGSKVRVVAISEISKEFCGGTHLEYTGQIGLFKITSESSVSSGVRRIEAVVGRPAEDLVRKNDELIADLSEKLKVSSGQIIARVDKMSSQIKLDEKEITALKTRLATGSKGAAEEREISGVKILSSRIDGLDINALRQAGDEFKSRIKSGVIILFGKESPEKGILICMVTNDLCGKIHAGNLTREIIAIAQGSGGGNPEMGQAGTKQPDLLGAAMDASFGLIEKKLTAC